MRLNPAPTIRSMNSRLTGSGRSPGSFCRPSRGPTSMISTVRDLVMVMGLYTRRPVSGSPLAAVDGPLGRIVYTGHGPGRIQSWPPRRPTSARTRNPAGRPVLRPAPRRHGRGGHQDRTPGAGRPDAQLGPPETGRAVALVAGHRAQQARGHARPPPGRRAEAVARARGEVRHPDREFPPGHAREMEPRLGAAFRRKPAPRDGARLR